MQYYAWCRFWRDTHAPAWVRRSCGILQAALTSVLPATMLARRVLHIEPPVWVVWLGFVWAGITFLTMWGFAHRRGAAVVSAAFQRPAAGSPAAHRVEPPVGWYSRHTLGPAPAAWLCKKRRRAPRVDRVRVPLPRLPAALNGFTIAQISDLHIAPLLGYDYVARVVAQVNALGAQVIVITGDLVDGSVEQLHPTADLLGGLRAPHGVYFVTGNHEYYSGADAWLAHLVTLGIKPLRNSHVSIGTGEHSFDLAGIDDLSGVRYPGHGPDIEAALAGRDPERALVLLAHQPKAIFMAAKHNVGLMLSGHTHAGQLWPLGFLVRLVQPYVEGLALHEQTYIYVNRGTGYVGPPMRLHAVPEITYVELTA